MKHVAFICMLLVSVQLVLGQQDKYRVEQFIGQDGLSIKGLLNITQDEHGYLWFRTDEGIVKYDGYTFTSYTQDYKDPNALFQKVDILYDDMQGHVWISYSGLGFSFLDKSTDEFINFKSNPEDESYIGNQDILTFHSVEDKVWIGTEFGLYVFYYDDQRIEFIEETRNLSVSSLHTDNIGNLWIGTDTSDESKIDLDGISLYLYEPSKNQLHGISGKETESINQIHQDQQGPHMDGNKPWVW